MVGELIQWDVFGRPLFIYSLIVPSAGNRNMPPLIKLNYSHLIKDAVKLVYNDPLTGGSPDIELTVVDKGYTPIAVKDALELEIGRTESVYRLMAGIFEVDRVDRVGGDKLWTIAATGLPLSDPQLKVKRDEDYAEFKLLEILKIVAERYDLSVFSRNLPDIEFSQLSQTNQSDLEFLNSLATRIGAVFKVENRQLIFTLLIDLEKREPLFYIRTAELIKHTETVLGTGVYQFLDYEVVLFGDREYVRVEDDRVSNGRVMTYRGGGVTADDENLLRIAAREQLRQINSGNHLFTIDVPGSSQMIAGSVLLFDGKPAFCDRVTHTIDTGSRNFWNATLNCRLLPIRNI